MSTFISIILIIIGFFLLIKGADLLLKAATSIAKKFGVSELLIGLTIVAIGTSLPEIFITISSAMEGHPDLIIGNAIGSCICNFLLVIGITSLIKPIKLEKNVIDRHLPIGIGAMVLILILGNTHNFGEYLVIDRWQGVLLILCTIAYILYTIYEEKKIKNKKIDDEVIKDVENKGKYSTKMILIYLILGILGLKFGADLVVDNAMIIAELFGFSEKFIGMTIVAVGTALPEIITGVMAARNDETDVLLGNVSGSNILNLCFLIGLGAIINPLTFTTDFNISLLFLIGITIYIQLIAIINKKSELSRGKGFSLIVIYFIYICRMMLN